MEFQWDDGKRAKCLKHGVSGAEIEEMFLNGPVIRRDEKHSGAEERYFAIGYSVVGRSIFVVFTIRQIEGQSLLRPISPRFMHAKERQVYEEATS